MSRTNPRKGPLRKVVGYEKNFFGTKNQYHSFYEKLECGHAQPIVRDCFGETNAVRRRCRKCLVQEDK